MTGKKFERWQFYLEFKDIEGVIKDSENVTFKEH